MATQNASSRAIDSAVEMLNDFVADKHSSPIPLPSAEVPTQTSNDPTNVSATARVLAIPELLENILRLATSSPVYAFTTNKRSAPVSGRRHYRTPCKRLFILQRVNSTFKAVICRSKVLQQRMFLQAFDPPKEIPSDMVHTSCQESFQWLISGVVIELNYVQELTGRPEQLRLDSRSKSGVIITSSPAASWRKMKLHCVKGRGLIDIILCTEFDADFPVCKFREQDEMTLGKLYEGLKKLLPLLALVQDLERRTRSIYLNRNIWAPKKLELAKENLRVECARTDLWD
ncbi:uncharacterized protein RCC_05147 [Ramularia collo-cygni]|uniref:Uncharacterized protein n=1 Tax=Ramularia collo-cygni TaxID=112498 RepID=A0A2D3VCE5_9PEZI|nr:uncharacterized protein RCC_05147 [Ramularia collo-cygni]CZT19299.1 uncharacterized protein RCC_05147 [Ramularia collo-cygni]